MLHTEVLSKEQRELLPFLKKFGKEYGFVGDTAIALHLGHKLEGSIKIPSLLTLAAMKAFALGQRSKWKDYVDLYFIMKDHFTCAEIFQQAKALFAGEFNPKLFRMQLDYFGDVDYREKVQFMPGFAVSEKKVQKALREFSLA